MAGSTPSPISSRFCSSGLWQSESVTSRRNSLHAHAPWPPTRPRSPLSSLQVTKWRMRGVIYSFPAMQQSIRGLQSTCRWSLPSGIAPPLPNPKTWEQDHDVEHYPIHWWDFQRIACIASFSPFLPYNLAKNAKIYQISPKIWWILKRHKYLWKQIGTSNWIFMATNKNINRIKVVLAEKSLTNKWLAEKLGKDQATVSKWCTNNAQPTLEMLLKIASVLQVDVRELLRPTEDDATYIRVPKDLTKSNF